MSVKVGKFSVRIGWMPPNGFLKEVGNALKTRTSIHSQGSRNVTQSSQHNTCLGLSKNSMVNKDRKKKTVEY